MVCKSTRSNRPSSHTALAIYIYIICHFVQSVESCTPKIAKVVWNIKNSRTCIQPMISLWSTRMFVFKPKAILDSPRLV